MAIVISGVNNNDKITAADGTIDLLSGVNYAGIITAPAFTTPGNLTSGHLNVGSNIQLGNAGVATATTFVGNLTGNVNATSNLLLQIGGSEKFRVGGSGQLGIGGANYGTSGQVLTSGGSGSAATWSTILTPDADKIIEGNTKAEVVDTGSNGHFKVETEGAERLRITSTGVVGINSDASGNGSGSKLVVGGRIQSNSGGYWIADSNGAENGWHIQDSSGDLTIVESGVAERVRITSGGKLTMSSGTVELQQNMIRVGNRTTAQINAGVSTATGSLVLDTTENNLKYYANAQWETVKKAGNDGSSPTLAARSAKALLDDGITTSGVYWLNMHGAYTQANSKRHYCLMDTSYDGGGWTLLYSMNHGNNFASGSNYSFALNVGSNPTTINDFLASNFGYDRRNTFTPQANDQFLIRRSDNNDWKRFVVSTWSPTYNNISDGWSCTRSTDGQNRSHPYYAYGQMYDSSGNAVSGMVHFNGCALGGNCNSGGGDGDGFGDHINWSSGYAPYSCWGGAYNAQSNGGSPLYWGQNNQLSQGGSLYVQMFYRRTGTQ